MLELESLPQKPKQKIANHKTYKIELTATDNDIKKKVKLGEVPESVRSVISSPNNSLSSSGDPPKKLKPFDGVNN